MKYENAGDALEKNDHIYDFKGMFVGKGFLQLGIIIILKLFYTHQSFLVQSFKFCHW